MNQQIQQLSGMARKAAQAKNWATVKACARNILKQSTDSAEGHFLLGLAEKGSNRSTQAMQSFSKAIRIDSHRYDAAAELAELYLHLLRYGDAVTLLQYHVPQMDNSPRYLDFAGTIYTNVGLPERAWPLYQKANELQPGVDSLRAKLAACSVYVGNIDEAKKIYRQLLEKHPNHQRNHYELSRLETATDSTHIEQMEAALQATGATPEKNIYLNYALGKELEDLGKWDEAFTHYKTAGDAAASVSNYDVRTDIRLIDEIIEVCDEDWLADGSAMAESESVGKVPVFIVGLPRTGTTLTERILSCHSQVESIGESYFMQAIIRKESRVKGNDSISPAMIRAAARKDIRRFATGYMDAVAYKFGEKPMFIEKFPENYLYLGFIAKAFPHARIIHLDRNPMDSCFALYKQSFFRYAYTLEDLGPYYVAYNRLHEHWRDVLGNRLIEVTYEALVSDQDRQTRRLLEELELEFEDACLNFQNNEAASNTASTVQIREKIHTRSVQRWMCFEERLQPLKNYLEEAGIAMA